MQSPPEVDVEATQELFDLLMRDDQPNIYAVMCLVPTNMLKQECTLRVRAPDGRILNCVWRPQGHLAR